MSRMSFMTPSSHHSYYYNCLSTTLHHGIVMCVVLSMIIGAVSALRCHSCQSAHSNEACNANIVECSDRTQHGCYTEVQKTEPSIGGKVYKKGCMEHSECKELERLNSEAYCSRTPSKCTYCCKSGSNCNAYNYAYPTYTTTRTQTMYMLALAALCAVYVCVMHPSTCVRT